MFENMIICVEILLSLDICVKYVQCVKICLFLKCVQFPEVLCLVSGEAKGRRAYRMRVSHLSKGGRTFWRRVSILLNVHKKKKAYRLFSTGIHHAPARGMLVCTHTPNLFVPTGTQRPDTRSTAWSTTYLKSSKHIDCHGFTS
jgi:hypothetical protein